MNSPQLEYGYTRIANEILEVVSKAKFNGTQYKILMVIWRYTYGFNKKEGRFSLKFLSEATNCNKQQVKRELDRLIENKVITVVKEAGFNTSRILSFNKHYSEWNVEGIQSFKKSTVSELAYATVSEKEYSTVSELAYQQRQYKDNIKDIEEDEEERVLSLENSDKVPSLCQEEDDPVLEFLNQVSSYYTTLTGRLTSPNDEVAITDIAKHTNDFELVKEAMDNTFRNYKPRYKGDKIRGFRYFVPGILERIAIEKERQKRREVKVANGNDFLGTETERTPKFDKSKFLYQGNG